VDVLNFVREFLRREDGPTSVEYAVNLALVVGVLTSSVSSMTTRTKATFNTVSTAVKTTGS
jgi:pilus assembly protein Flp/PilA